MVVSVRVSTGTIAELDRRQKKIREAIKNLEDRRKVLNEMKRYMVMEWAQDFDSQKGWAPTSAAYQKTRVQKGNSPTPTLNETGALRAVFQSQNEQGRVNAASVTWTFRNEIGTAYPVSHHTGYNLGQSSVPARQLWDIDTQDESIMAEMIEDFVAQQLDL